MGHIKKRWIESMEPRPQEWDRRWIPVSEQMPDERTLVLCGDDFDGWVEVLQFEHWSGWVTRRGDPAYANPTHWMKLPEPPKTSGPESP
jgi:hypothetical protein